MEERLTKMRGFPFQDLRNAVGYRRVAAFIKGISLASVLLILSSCEDGSATDDRGTMPEGVHALYERGDAPAAVGIFESILKKQPGHYGARYQLAVALEGAGRREEALATWRRFLSMAERTSDEEYAAVARDHIRSLTVRAPPGVRVEDLQRSIQESGSRVPRLDWRCTPAPSNRRD